MNSDPVVEVVLFRAEEPVWCVHCSRQAYYSVECTPNQRLVCGRHLLKAVRELGGQE